MPQYQTPRPSCMTTRHQRGASIVEYLLMLGITCLLVAASISAFTSQVNTRAKCIDLALQYGGGTDSTTARGHLNRDDPDRNYYVGYCLAEHVIPGS